MPSVPYANQSGGPFWDFVADMQQQNNDRAANLHNVNNEIEHGQEPEVTYVDPMFGPWGWNNNFYEREFPHRGPPPSRDVPHMGSTPSREVPHGEPSRGVPTDPREGELPSQNTGKARVDDEKMNDYNDNGEGPAGNSSSDNEGHAGGRGRHGRCGGGRRRGHCGPNGHCGPWGYGDHRHGWPYYNTHEFPHGGPHHSSRGFGRRGGWAPWGRQGLFGAGGNPLDLHNHFMKQFNDMYGSNTEGNSKSNNDNEDHTPDADIFDTETAFVVHVSLPGAKKEDVGVNWDAEKSELSVAGVIYRPGDEEFLKTLTVNERKIGPFERKIRLGTKATPAHIDADGITAKLEDGILRVKAPKLDAGYVEIKKVDIE